MNKLVLFFVLSLFGSFVLADLPTFNVEACSSPILWNTTASTNSTAFYLADCSGPALQQTVVNACYDNTYLHLHFYCLDNNIYSPYTQCNDHLYNDDVVEVFIAPDLPNDDPIHNYIELELSPNGVLFAADVTNPDLTCNGITDDNYPCSYFTYSAQRYDDEGYWTGTIGIPWSILATYPGAGPQLPPSDIFRVNFFRIDTPLYQEKEYSGWSCDNSSPACFHEPLYFGYLQLQ